MIKKLLIKHAPWLACPRTLNPEAILWAIYRCEKYGKGKRVPRYEPAYAPGGKYYKRSEMVREEFAKWGPSAACSYSDFQILYITAVELGWEGPPLALDRNEIAIKVVVDYLNNRVFSKGAATPEEVADAYNSGTFKDMNVPTDYMLKFRYFYDGYVREQCMEPTPSDNDSSSEPQV